MVYAKYITTGILVRVILILTILVLPIDYRIKTIAIFLTDFIDCSTSKLIAWKDKIMNVFKICKSYRYQSSDKAVDLLTYIVLYFYLGLSPLYLFIILLRLLGITLFYILLNANPLIIFPDLFKELLLYSWFISPINSTNFTIIYISKVIFEYIWHTYHNGNDYNNSVEEFKIYF